eukprot:6214808-Pleurochrysis_carterae.AAC.3
MPPDPSSPATRAKTSSIRPSSSHGIPYHATALHVPRYAKRALSLPWHQQAAHARLAAHSRPAA